MDYTAAQWITGIVFKLFSQAKEVSPNI